MMKSIVTMALLSSTRKYLIRVAVSFDIFVNVLLGGSINQTFSARNWQWKKDSKQNFVWLIDLLIFFDPDHCMHSWLYWKSKIATRKLGKRNVELVK